MAQERAFNIRAANVATYLLITVMVGWLLIIGRSLLIPLILALILWYLLDTIAHFLQNPPIRNFSIPYPIALVGAFMVMAVIIMMVVGMVSENAAMLAQQAPSYQATIEAKVQSLMGAIAPKAEFQMDKLNDLFNLQKLVGWTTSAISNIVSTLTLVVIYLLFIFMEKQVFEQKFVSLFSDTDTHTHAVKIRKDIMQRIRIYLSVKTFVSILTGLLSFVLLKLIGVDYAAFWGFIIFLLNYIPTIGSLLGVIFPAALSLVQFDTSWQFFAVVVVLGMVQFAIGNILEPRLMGSRLNLSGLAIMLALAIWGAMWGITGMILSVPMTVVIMIICAQFPSSRGVAILLSSDGNV